MIEKPPVASVVQVVQPPPGANVDTEGSVVPPAPAKSTHVNTEETTDENDIFEDPTPPQKLEGRLAGLEPVIGTPQMTLGDAVGAGKILVIIFMASSEFSGSFTFFLVAIFLKVSIQKLI